MRLGRWCGFIGSVLLMLAGGCVQVPVGHQTIRPEALADATPVPTTHCRPELLTPLAAPNLPPSGALDANGFTLVSWNLQKGRKKGWTTDLDHLIAGADIVLLQEARLSPELSRLLEKTVGNWDLAPAFVFRGLPTGVLTATQSAPVMRCVSRSREPLWYVPKSMLMTRYAFAGGEPHLLVVNLHAINFTLGTARYRELWRALEKVIASYSGPLIVAGDFNTWSDSRMNIVEQTMSRMGLTSVAFTAGRSTFWGHAVDHVYYRGLIPQAAAVPQVHSSDHHPLAVTFRLARSALQ